MTLPNSSEPSLAFSRSTSPTTTVTATSASTTESSSTTTTTSTTLTSTTLAIPDDLLEKTMTPSSTEKSETTAVITRRTTTIPDYHTNLVEEMRALRKDYELHGGCLFSVDQNVKRKKNHNHQTFFQVRLWSN